MQQLEIEYFFPLTEQIPLDLDYEPSKLYAKELNRQRSIDGTEILFGGTGLTLMSTGSNVTWSTHLSGWDIGTKQEPSKFRKLLMKYLIGWKWVG